MLIYECQHIDWDFSLSPCWVKCTKINEWFRKRGLFINFVILILGYWNRLFRMSNTNKLEELLMKWCIEKYEDWWKSALFIDQQYYQEQLYEIQVSA